MREKNSAKQKAKTHFFLSFSLSFQTISFFCSIWTVAYVVVSGDDGDDNDDDYDYEWWCLVCSDCGIYMVAGCCCVLMFIVQCSFALALCILKWGNFNQHTFFHLIFYSMCIVSRRESCNSDLNGTCVPKILYSVHHLTLFLDFIHTRISVALLCVRVCLELYRYMHIYIHRSIVAQARFNRILFDGECIALHLYKGSIKTP